MAAATVDTAYISGYTSIPQPSIQSLIDSPTTELVTSFLQQLVAKARDHDALKSERLRQDVELENAVRGGESRAQTLKANADKALKEVEALRRKLNEEESSRTTLQSQLQSLQSSTSTSSSDVEGLRAQVNRLESSNRETLALLDSKSTAHDRLAEDLAAQHQKSVALRRDIASLEERKQSADNLLSESKFRQSALQQEVEMLKRSNEWLDSELKTKTQDYSKYRKEKSAKIAELQRLNDDAASKVAALQRTEAALRKQLDEVNQKADNAFSKIQQMQDQATRTEESFRAELGNSRRLAELQQQSAETARRRVQELDEIVEQTKSDVVDELGQVQAELETERQGKDIAEQRVEQLELQVEKMEANLANAPPASSRPGTPLHNAGAAGPFGTPGRAGSPSNFTPGSTRTRGGLSFTQLFTEYNNAKAELENEKRRSSKLGTTIDELIADLEKREPEVQESRMERARLESEVSQLSASLAKAGQDRDSLRKDCRRWEGQAEGLSQEGDILRQQLRDLSAQIKILLVEVQIRSEGVDMNAADRQQLQEAAQRDSELAFEGMSDTGRFISERLATFKNIFELQENNTKLLQLTRQLGEQMEGEEAKAKQTQQDQERVELEDLRMRVERYKDELRSLSTQAQSYVRERDMFRRMLAHRGQIPRDADLDSMFGDSVNGATPGTPRLGASMSEAAQTPGAREHADQMKMLKEMQSHFDAYRREAATDHSTLRGQIDSLAKDKSDLQGEIARASSQLTLAHERYDMLQANYSLAKTESDELQKRSQSLAEVATRQDIRTQQVAEELVEARGLSESMRNENANLKAEREFSKRIETRLAEENSSLREERGQLNKALSDSRSLANERELSDSESRRKLQAQVETLETDLRTTKRKLDEEVDEGKKANLRREYEHEQNRTRIDDLVKALGNTKEELVAAKTTRDQLQARVEELKIELRNAQEHAQALQPRPTPRPPVTPGAVNGDSTNDDGQLNREQELSIEIADLKRELDLAKGELESTLAQVEQYKAIAQGSEEELQNLNEAYDEYKEDADKVTAEKDIRIRDLEQRAEEISQELSITNIQLSELQASSQDINSRLDQQRSIYESELTRVKDESDRHLETSKFHQEDLKAQAEIAQQAQQSYENELVKHAEAAKALQKARADYNELRLEIGTSKADVETARATVIQNEESWSSIKEQYEREMLELRRRRDDVDGQNKLLHQQLESVSSQISSLQQRRVPTEDEDEVITTSSNTGLQNLQEVIKYLRREKEIVDVQYELSVQEARRLKQQLDYSQAQLDDARLRLDQERQRQADKDRTSSSHSKLVDTINELNVFRESTVTLRNEARQAQAQLAVKSKRVDELVAEIQPLQMSIREMENQLETSQGEYKLLQEDKDRWQKRTQDILQKYDRVDPAEMEELKQRLETLQRERDEATSHQQTLQSQVESLPEELQKAKDEASAAGRKEMRDKLQGQFKEKVKELNAKINNAQAETKAAREQLEPLNSELESLRSQLANSSSDQPHALNQAADTTDDAVMQDGEEGEVDEEHQESGDTSGKQGEIQLQSQISTLQGQMKGLQARADELQSNLDSERAELARLRESTPADGEGTNEHLEKLRQDLDAAQGELDILRSAGGADSTEQQETSDNPEVAVQVSSIRAELEKAHSLRVQQLEESFNKRSESMRLQLSTKLREGKAAYQKELQSDFEQKLQQAKGEHESALTKAKEDLESELFQARQELEQTRNQEPAETTAGADGATSDASAVKSEASGPEDEWTQKPELVRKFVTTNPTVMQMVKGNVRNHVDREKVESAKKIEELEQTHVQKVEELQKKSETTRVQAIEMESKKWKVKITMEQNRARTATAKLEIFQKAANETPEKAVAEVWLIAKDFKPPPLQAAQAPAPVTDAPPQTVNAQPKPGPIATAIATAKTPAVAQTPPQPQSPAPAQSAPHPVQPQGRPSQAGQPSAPANGMLPAKPPAAQGTGPSSAKGTANPGSGIPRGGASIRGAATRGGRGGQMRPATGADGTSKLPDAPLGQQPAGRGALTGTVRGAGRRMSQIPARGGAQGAGAGAGRGGSAAMNAGAKQFVPGNKRPREDSTGGADGGGKKARGGGAAGQ